MELIWALVCKSSVVDRDTNSLTINEVVEEITLELANPPDEVITADTRYPVPVGVVLISLWRRSQPADEPEKGTVRISILEDGDAVGSDHDIEIDLREYRRVRSRFTVPMMPLQVGRPGRREIRFDIALRDEGDQFVRVGSVPVELNVPEIPAAPEVPPPA